jgi:uncharacterized protein
MDHDHNHHHGNLRIRWHPGDLAVCRFEPNAALPDWAAAAICGQDGSASALISVTRTGEEWSIVAPTLLVPRDVRHESPFRAAQVIGPLDFALVGVLARLTGALADAEVPVLTLSTYDTDYLLVRAADVQRATAALTEAGMTFE